MIQKALRAGSHYFVRYYTKLERTSLSVICVRRKGKMSPERPAAGRESAKGRFLFGIFMYVMEPLVLWSSANFFTVKNIFPIIIYFFDSPLDSSYQQCYDINVAKQSEEEYPLSPQHRQWLGLCFWMRYIGMLKIGCRYRKIKRMVDSFLSAFFVFRRDFTDVPRHTDAP